MKWYYLVGLTISVTVITLFIRIPLPSKGYFNFGDIAVVFSGLLLGSRGGMIAGGIGSALADIIGGFPAFAPLTLVAKGLEGLFCGMAKNRKPLLKYFFLSLGVTMMAIIYFTGFSLIKFYGGIGLAVSELPFNLIQAIGGYYGGIVLHKLIRLPK
jgi:uncharacterized membrane protein